MAGGDSSRIVVRTDPVQLRGLETVPYGIVVVASLIRLEEVDAGGQFIVGTINPCIVPRRDYSSVQDGCPLNLISSWLGIIIYQPGSLIHPLTVLCPRFSRNYPKIFLLAAFFPASLARSPLFLSPVPWSSELRSKAAREKEPERT